MDPKKAVYEQLRRVLRGQPALLVAFLTVLLLSFIGDVKEESLTIRSIGKDQRGKVVVKGRRDRFRPALDQVEELRGFQTLELEEKIWSGKGEKSLFISPYTRFEWKERIDEGLKNRFQDKEVADLFCSLVIGTPLPNGLQELFRKTGLLHIVAISGFHFTLLRGVLLNLLGVFLRGKGRLTLLLLLLGAYALLLGAVPSVLRAFFACFISLVGELIERRSNALNTFGISLLLTLLVDWTLLFDLSFQLSFGITFSILVLYPLLSRVHRIPDLNRVRNENKITQIFLSLRTLFEKSLLFSLSVTAVALPLSLSTFGTFPVFGILINLLFTPLFAFLAAGVFVTTLLPFLNLPLEGVGELVLKLLKLFDRPLPVLDFDCPPAVTIFVLSLLFLLALFETKNREYSTNYFL